MSSQARNTPFTGAAYGERVESFIVRVWMPDRPGALGAVASRIGAAGGDVVGIEILEQGAGRAIDELVVELPDPDLVTLLISEVSQVDGVDIEEVRATGDLVPDQRLAALQMAAALVAAPDRAGLLTALCREASAASEATWAVVVDLDEGTRSASLGETPTVVWLLAFLQGAGEDSAASDVVQATLVPDRLVLVVGRDGAAFRDRVRRRVAVLADIAATRFAELSGRPNSR